MRLLQGESNKRQTKAQNEGFINGRPRHIKHTVTLDKTIQNADLPPVLVEFGALLLFWLSVSSGIGNGRSYTCTP